MPHVVYLHLGLTHDRIVPRNTDEARQIYHDEKIDVIAVMVLAGLINMAMRYMAASVLLSDWAHRRGEHYHSLSHVNSDFRSSRRQHVFDFAIGFRHIELFCGNRGRAGDYARLRRIWHSRVGPPSGDHDSDYGDRTLGANPTETLIISQYGFTYFQF